MVDWKTLLDGGDFPGAITACLRQFEGRANTFAAAQALSEVEERWGDWLVRSGLPGAAEHYSAAGKLLVSPNLLVNSVEESRLLVTIYPRVMGKLSTIDPFGRSRAWIGWQPNTASGDGHPPPEPVQMAECPCRHHAAVPSFDNDRSAYAQLFRHKDHWCHYDLGRKWRDAGMSLAVACPEAAYGAYSWSLYFFDLYRVAWDRAGAVARWDSDGEWEIAEVRNMAYSLAVNLSESSIPSWAEAFLTGDWQRASALLGDGLPAPEWSALAILLAGAGQTAKEQDSGM
jgi:hypothetical protein